jgi:UDPglucose 6-dehydrogenase
MKILIIGTGYVGLVTGVCLAEMGHHIICLDIDNKKIDMLNHGQIPIYEPGLLELVKRNTKAKRLKFSNDYKTSTQFAEVCFLAVPSPSQIDGSCDTSFVQNAAKELAKHINNYKVIVNKSTVPVGTAFLVKDIILSELRKRKAKYTIDVVANPEFLKEGSAITDCMKPDRIIIGADSEKAVKIMQEVYAPFTIINERIMIMDILSAEMTKYAANAMLATRISFMNEIASICKKVGANINEVRKGVGADSRIGYSFLYAGIGYGGSCFPKDIRALAHIAKKVGHNPELLNAVEKVNNRQRHVIVQNIINYFQQRGGVKGKTIAIWGLSFKPDTDDVRDAPALDIIKALLKKGAILRLYDPIATDNAKKHLPVHNNINWSKDELHAALGAHGIALLTEWKQFRLIDFSPILKNMKGKGFFDGRNQYKPHEMKKHGFDYIGIGMPETITPHE